MHTAVGGNGAPLEERLARRGVSRRRFLQWCGVVAAAMGLEGVGGFEVAQALSMQHRPSVIYLHMAECTGCSEALLRSPEPTIDALLFDVISLDYHETLMAAAGHKAEAALEAALAAPEGFYCIVEGAIPTADGGLYGYVGGKTMLDMCAKILPKAQAVLAYGTCASFGGIQAAAPNLTGARSVNACFTDEGIEAINIAGCPPNPINLVGTIVALLRGDALLLDKVRRPRMFYGITVHEQCERRHHFDAARFAPSFASEEARQGWCLYKLGCRGPMTLNNCPTALFNQTNWPVGAGHPCIGCSEPGFWDLMTPFYEYADRKRGTS